MGEVRFVVVSQPSGCGAGGYAFDGTTAQGRAMLATLIAAKHTTHGVYVSGNGSCVTPTHEGVAYIQEH